MPSERAKAIRELQALRMGAPVYRATGGIITPPRKPRVTTTERLPRFTDRGNMVSAAFPDAALTYREAREARVENQARKVARKAERSVKERARIQRRIEDRAARERGLVPAVKMAEF